MATESSALEQTRTTILRRVEEGIAEGPFSADWDSITSGYQVPDWYVDGKFGIFIHWGPYSVPAYSSEWYPREMYVQGSKEFKHHVATYGPQSQFGYKEFFQSFKAEKFDATAWAKEGRPGLPDGMAIDKQGHVWATGPGGIYCFTPEGKPIGRLNTGERTANCKFGDDGKTLFIAADMYVCRVKTNVTGTNY